MRALIIACLAVLVVGCQAPQSTTQRLVYSGGDGSSRDRAVIIGEVQSREVGTLAERVWLEERYPGYRESNKTTFTSADRLYDLVEFATADGQTRQVYFATTEPIEK
jgi:hypothetical protein